MEDPCDIELNAVYRKTKIHLIKSLLLVCLAGIVYCSALVFGCNFIAQSLVHRGVDLIVVAELGWYAALTVIWLYVNKKHGKWSDQRFDELLSEAKAIIEFHYPQH